MADEALRDFASGYLLKSSASGAEVSRAIIAVMHGKQYVSQKIADQRTKRFIRNPRQLQAPPLTYRQRQVLQLLVQRLSMKQVAAELNIKARTIAFHKYKIMAEHGLRNNSDLVCFAMKRQVVTITSAG